MLSPRLTRVLKSELDHIDRQVATLDRQREALLRDRESVVAMLGEKKRTTRDVKRVAKRIGGRKSARVERAEEQVALWRPKPVGKRIEGGPTEALTRVLRDAPEGLTYGEVVNRAVKGVTTTASNPIKSVGNVLLSMRQRGKVQVREGKYFLATQGQ